MPQTNNILTGVFIVVAGASIWRGITRLEDIYFYPNDINLSILMSLLEGIIILRIKGKDIRSIIG